MPADLEDGGEEGRCAMAIEEHPLVRRSVPKEIEKGQVRQLWAARSGGRCAFAMLFKLDGGMSVAQQLDGAIRQKA